MRQPLDPPAIPGATFVRHLGSGGFADVYLFRQQMPQRDVAVKVLRPDSNAQASAAFDAEVNLMARVSNHPSIVSFYTGGIADDGRHYLVMEYCPPPPPGRPAERIFVNATPFVLCIITKIMQTNLCQSFLFCSGKDALVYESFQHLW